jgi:gamma-glutamylcyclotransferase (GGCT)/AIG2-like uncharacterized protein YtfP
MSEYVFVYGSLKPGFGGQESARMVSLMRHVGRAKVSGRLYDFGEYSGAIPDSTQVKLVVGELLELPDEAVLNKLDRYEEYDPNDSHASLFVRRRVQATLENGEIVNAWIYIYNRDPGDAPVIKSGEWTLQKNSFS